MALKRLMYVSKARSSLARDDVHAILETARKYNAASGVTGILLYTGDSFLQMIEGAPVAVDATYARICADPRHSQIQTLIEDEEGERQFPDWSMGFELRWYDEVPRADDWFELNPASLKTALPDSVTPDVRLLFTSFVSFSETVAA